MKGGFLNSSSSKVSKLRENTASSSQQNAQEAIHPLSLYERERFIGEGNFCEVFLVSRKDDRQKEFALKIYSKERVLKLGKVNDVRMEKHVLTKLKKYKHMNIVYLHETFQDRNNLYFLYEYAEEGELWDKIRNVGCLDVRVAAFYMCQLINAVDFLHRNNIVHRDIKCENIVLRKSGVLKLIDFGTAVDLNEPSVKPACLESSYHRRKNIERKRNKMNKNNKDACRDGGECNRNKNKKEEIYDGGKKFEEDANKNAEETNKMGERRTKSKKKKQNKFLHYVGTAQFLPPECLKNKNSKKKRDIWHLACTFYQLLVGVPPFQGSTEWFIYNNILEMNITFPPYVSDEAKDLMTKMMQKNPKKRMDIADVKNHPFFKDFQHLFSTNNSVFCNEDSNNNTENTHTYESIDKNIHMYYQEYFYSNEMKKMHQKINCLIAKFDEFCRKIDEEQRKDKNEFQEKQENNKNGSGDDDEEKVNENEICKTICQEETNEQTTPAQEEDDAEEKDKEKKKEEEKKEREEDEVPSTKERLNFNEEKEDKKRQENDSDAFKISEKIAEWNNKLFIFLDEEEKKNEIFKNLQERFSFELKRKMVQQKKEDKMHEEWLLKSQQNEGGESGVEEDSEGKEKVTNGNKEVQEKERSEEEEEYEDSDDDDEEEEEESEEEDEEKEERK